MVSPDFRDSDPLARFRACIEVQVEVARRRCRDSVSRLVGPNIDLFDIYAVFLDIDCFRPVECGCMGSSESPSIAAVNAAIFNVLVMSLLLNP